MTLPGIQSMFSGCQMTEWFNAGSHKDLLLLTFQLSVYVCVYVYVQANWGKLGMEGISSHIFHFTLTGKHFTSWYPIWGQVASAWKHTSSWHSNSSHNSNPTGPGCSWINTLAALSLIIPYQALKVLQRYSITRTHLGGQHIQGITNGMHKVVFSIQSIFKWRISYVRAKSS